MASTCRPSDGAAEAETAAAAAALAWDDEDEDPFLDSLEPVEQSRGSSLKIPQQQQQRQQQQSSRRGSSTKAAMTMTGKKGESYSRREDGETGDVKGRHRPRPLTSISALFGGGSGSNSGNCNTAVTVSG